MKGNYLRIVDTVQFSYLSQDWSKVKDDYEGAFKSPKPGSTHPSGLGQQETQAQENTNGLLIRIAATHSGIVTRNNGFYLPDKMNKGASSFTDNYGKPILLHHQDSEDNIGRIQAANYVDTSGGILDRFSNLKVRNSRGKETGTFNESMIKDFVEGNLPFGAEIDIVRSVFRDSVIDETGYAGLGHIELIANIVDLQAIEKLMDGRYLTGSVGATTDKAICSVCRTDWTKDSVCEHTPGAIYDDNKCFIIAGNLVYDEYSFVNVPADRHSKVLQLHYNGIQNNVEIANNFGRIYEAQLEFPMYDSVNKEGKNMKKSIKKDKSDQSIEDSIDDTIISSEAVISKDDISTETSDIEVKDNDIVDNKSDKLLVNNEAIVKESIKDFVVRILDAEEISIEEEDRSYQLLWDEVLAAVKDGELKLDQELLKDSKLSIKDRDKLPKSSFCGPNRSFPVSDCAHIVAVHRLLNNVKISDETKKRIDDCLERKSKVKNCDSYKSKEIKTEDNLHHSRIMHTIINLFEEDAYSTEEPVLDVDEKKMLQLILKRLSGLVGKDAVRVAIFSENLAEDETVLINEVTKNEDIIIDLQDRIDATQKEYHLLFEDMQNMQDSLVQEKISTRKIKEAHLKTFLALGSLEVKEHNFTELSDSDINTKLKDITESVDMIKITDKLGDGMSRIPKGNIEDPSGVHDSIEQKNNKFSVENFAIIEENYIQLRIQKGENIAESYLADMKKKGFLPQNS